MTQTTGGHWIDAYRRPGRLTGRCLCGAVEITVDGDFIAAVGVCHCGLCQRWTGNTWGSFEATAKAVTVQGEVAKYASTSFSERGFCPKCGTHLYLRNTVGEDDPYDLLPGIFEGAAEFPLVSEIYTDCAPAYVPLAGDHRRKTRAEYEATNLHIEGDLP
ncbi:MAG: GFA family protein [Pseudomonadota bacterium]